ncbi:hypothetical protein KC318_g21016, partial [Hortaea werneckii]
TPGAADPRKSATPITAEPRKSATPAQESDKMEGVRYRFEDRTSKKRAAAPDDGSDRKVPAVDRSSVDDDVEMEDARDESVSTKGSRTGTPYGDAVPSLDGGKSRAETPLSAISDAEGKVANPANGSVKPRPAGVAPPTTAAPPPQAAAMKKKATASPFIQKKPKARR